MKIKPIDPKLRPLLDRFLSKEDLQPKFAIIAKRLGYTGEDLEKIKLSLFSPDKQNQVCFADTEVMELFVDFQIIEQLSKVEPYKTLLKYQPETTPELIALARKILDEGEADTDAILALFPTPTSEDEIL